MVSFLYELAAKFVRALFMGDSEVQVVGKGRLVMSKLQTKLTEIVYILAIMKNIPQ